MTYDSPDWLEGFVQYDPTQNPPAPIVPPTAVTLTRVYEQVFTWTQTSSDTNLPIPPHDTSKVYCVGLSAVVWAFSDTGSDVFRWAVTSEFGTNMYAVVTVGVVTLPTSGELPSAATWNTFGAAAPVAEHPLKLTGSIIGGTGSGPTFSAGIVVQVGYVS